MGTFASNLKGKRRYLEGSTPERNVLILGGDERTLRIINSTTALEGKAERSIENQNLSSASSHRYRSATTCRGRTMGLQPGQRSVLFIYQRASATILWLSSVCNDVEDVELGCESVHRISACGSLNPEWLTRSGPPRSIIGLHPGNVGRETPVGGNPAKVPTFLNQFVKVGGNYPVTYFQTPGWVCSFK